MHFPEALSSSRPSTVGTRISSLLANELSISHSYLRFRQVPTFGNGVIRKFANNTSEMKRLAARDFEDILQVCLYHYLIFHMAHTAADIPSSVLFLFLKGYFLRNTIRLCSRCYINSHSGTHLRSSGFIQDLPWLFSKTHSINSPGSYGGFGLVLALPSSLRSYQKRKPRDKEGLLNTPKLI